jgi:hypothetical protein
MTRRLRDPRRLGDPRAVAALALLGVWGCGGGGAPSGTPNPSPRPGLATSVSTAPVQPGLGTQFSATIGYALPASGPHLGAYAAEIRFDPALVRFMGEDASAGHDRVVNLRHAESGSIVVAGASTAGFSDGVLFRGVFLALVPGVTPGTFQVSVREAADTELQPLVE